MISEGSCDTEACQLHIKGTYLQVTNQKMWIIHVFWANGLFTSSCFWKQECVNAVLCWPVLTQGQAWGDKGQCVDWLGFTHWRTPRSCRVHTHKCWCDHNCHNQSGDDASVESVGFQANGQRRREHTKDTTL